jgi:hypothetical protein
MNQHCFCIGLDDQALSSALFSPTDGVDLDALTRERCPHLFAAQPVFASADVLERMAQVVKAIDTLVQRPEWQERALAHAPAHVAAIARHPARGVRGVFFGYDFHLDGERLGLIEINTNAGGALLNAVAARAQRACCDTVQRLLPPLRAPDALERDIIAMFRTEWALAQMARPLRRIAIVDQAPQAQYLYPEFLLFQRLFLQHGLEAVVLDPGELRFDGQALRDSAGIIDLVYNRLTDFSFDGPDVVALREAYLADAVVVTSNPRAHALYADKRHLAVLSDDAALRELGVPRATRELLLQSVPHTQVVRADDAEALWLRRRQLFFKPSSGFGSRAAYRGDKLTRRVWESIVAGDYVAQELVPPGERHLQRTDADAQQGATLKYDLRNYVYDGKVQWVAARLFQGQTTNFRTPGGGFAPVYRAPGAVGTMADSVPR